MISLLFLVGLATDTGPLQAGRAEQLTTVDLHLAGNGQNLKGQSPLSSHDVGNQLEQGVAVIAIDADVVLVVLEGDQLLGQGNGHEADTLVFTHPH